MRKINEIIIHCSATREGCEYSGEVIKRWHVAKGYADIGYHYVIHLDGVVETGRDVAKIGAHCKGHNIGTIGVCYVGGLDIKGRAKDTRTPEQKKALRLLIRSIVREQAKVGNMITKVSGHNEYANKACPCFNVKNENYLDI